MEFEEDAKSMIYFFDIYERCNQIMTITCRQYKERCI